jgi:hypothetical protein
VSIILHVFFTSSSANVNRLGLNYDPSIISRPMYLRPPTARENVSNLAITVRQITFAALLTAALAVCGAAQDQEIAKTRVAGGYSHLRLPFNVISVSGKFIHAQGDESFHRPGLWIDPEWNPVPWLSLENYVGIYYFPGNVTVLADIPGGKLVARNLFDSPMSPYLVGGLGIGLFKDPNGFLGGRGALSASAIGRYGLGTDVQLSRQWAFRLDASRMPINFSRWTTSWNVSGGLVYSMF